MQSKHEWGLYFFGILLVMIFLAGCSGIGSADVDMTVYTGERYKMTIALRIPTQFLSLMGGTSGIESKLDEMVATSAADGEKVTWRRDKNAPPDEIGYIIEASGTGFDSAGTGFLIQPTVYNGKDALRFDGNFRDFGDLNSFSFTLHGGEILDSNGMEVDKGSVQWSDPYKKAYAIFTPKNRINWLYVSISIAIIFGCSGTLLAGVLIVFLLVRRDRRVKI